MQYISPKKMAYMRMSKDDKPKRPRSAYALWLTDNKRLIMDNLPRKMSNHEKMLHLADMWRTISDEERQAYFTRRLETLKALGFEPPAERNRVIDPEPREKLQKRPKDKKPPQNLPGWKQELVAGRMAWSHEESGALVWEKPKNKVRVLVLFERKRAQDGVHDATPAPEAETAADAAMAVANDPNE